MSTTVLVSGAAGFIASHVVDVLLSKGYTVIGTSRSVSKGNESVKLFKTKYPDAKLSFVAVSEISEPGAFDNVLKDHPEITQVLHTASSLSFDAKKNEYQEKLIDPAVNGTIGILNSIKKYGPNVENVITGSIVSVLTFPLNQPAKTFTAKDWNPIEIDHVTDDSMTGYAVSKKYAEKASIEWIKRETPKFSVCAINPFYVLGPRVFDDWAVPSRNVSNEVLFSSIRKQSDNYIPLQNTLSVDVRDVAKFHVLAMENGVKSNGFRFLLGHQHFYDQGAIDVVLQHVPEAKLEYKGRPQEVPIPAYIRYQDSVDEVGGYDFIDFDKTVADAVSQYVRVNGRF